jgi:hypothetical protein
MSNNQIPTIQYNWSAQDLVDSSFTFDPYDKDKWYVTDGGKCLGGAYFARKGLKPTNPPDARAFRTMKLGELVEQVIVEQMERGLFPLMEKGEVDDIITQDYLLDDKLHVGGRSDILVISKKYLPLLYEVKSIHSKGFWWLAKSNNKPHDHYVAQINWYLKRYREIYPGIQARLLYVSRDDMSVLEIPVEYNEEIANISEDKFRSLNEAWEKDILPPVEPPVVFNQDRGKYDVNFKAKWCWYHDKCLNDKDWLKKAEEEVIKLNNENGTVSTTKGTKRNTNRKSNK